MNALARTKPRQIMLLALTLTLLSGTLAGLAQQPPAEKVAESPAEQAESGEATADAPAANDDSLGSQIFKAPESTSDWFALFFYAMLGIFSIFAATVTLERLVNLRRSRILPSPFEKGLTDILGQSSPSQTELSDLAKQWPSPIARILTAALDRAGRPLSEVEKAMEDAALREISEMRSKHRPLNVVGSTAPLVGLLGTVVGMIFAFQISSQLGLGKAEQLARGIYLALLTTAGGLTIAIPTLLLSAWFQGRVERFFRQIDQALMPLIPFFTKLEKRSPTTPLKTSTSAGSQYGSPAAISKNV
ncbi:MAG: MotA/TolQ/ExbB proton channel family protein [Planctomycetaceae bacterium]|nr:MotA/TolQ/ExbB proton channel family protein [Planctomycetaceae bacterium]